MNKRCSNRECRALSTKVPTKSSNQQKMSSASSSHRHQQHDQEIFLLTLNASDLLRISPAEPTLEKVVVAAVSKAWPRGLQASQRKLHDQVAEYKLRGDPWLPTGVLDAMPQGAPLILALLRGFSLAGFRVQGVNRHVAFE
jgi:hypothetical protein